MASVLISDPAIFTLSFPRISRPASFKPLHLSTSPAIRLTRDRKTMRGLTVVTRAGASTSSYIFAIALPLSLLAVTIFTAIKISDKLDKDFLEEIAINEAIRKAEEEEDDGDDDGDDDEDYDEEDDDGHISAEEEEQQQPVPVISSTSSRTRNRPQRQA